MLSLFKENEITKEIDYCVRNPEKLPRLDLKSPLKKDRYGNPSHNNYKNSTFHTLIVHDDGEVETKGFFDQLYLMNNEDQHQMNRLIQIVNEKMMSLELNETIKPETVNELIDYRNTLIDIYHNRFVQENIPSIINHVYQTNHK